MLFLLVLGAACVPPKPAAAPESVQLQSFEYAWKRVQESHHDPDMGGLDWQAVHDELVDDARAAQTNQDLRSILSDMLGRLEASHFQVVPSDIYEAGYARNKNSAAGSSHPPNGTVGLEVRWVEDALRVSRILPGGPAETAGIRTGDVIVGIDNANLKDLVERAREADQPDGFTARAAARDLAGPPGEEVALSIVSKQDEPAAEIVLTRVESTGQVVQLGYLPPITVVFEHEMAREGVGLIRFNVFMHPVGSRFTEAMIDLLELGASAIVVDLRGNPGGVVAMTMGMAGHFVGTPGQSLGRITQRQMDLELRINPRMPAQRTDGPVAILMDGLSASTSEVFAAGLQGLGRARVFGTRSAGMALPSIFEALPNGDGLQFAIGDLHGPTGVRLEGQGVTPDQLVPLTAEALEAGRDPALDAAFAWIESELHP
jgi:carboxyl-terminal processing protease